MPTMIVPADQPTYIPVGGNKLMLLGEWNRTIECRSCQRSENLKLVADQILENGECDELLDAYLVQRGWRVVHNPDNPCAPGDYELCPDCATPGDGH